MATPQIFVSHSSVDDEFGKRLVADLRSRLGNDAVWYDASGYMISAGLHGGDEWWKLIVSEITKRDTFIVILSPDAVKSSWVMDEVGIAWALRHKIGTRIIPIMFRETDPRADLLLLQIIDFTAKPYEQAFSELVGSLPTRSAEQEEPSAPAPVRPHGPREEYIERQTHDIHAAFGFGDWNSVIERSNLLLKDAPDQMSFILWRECGLAYLELNKGKDALTALNNALAENEYDIFTLRGKGIALQQVGQGEEAALVLEEAYKQAPYTDVSLRLTLLEDLVRALREVGEWNSAVRWIDQGLRLSQNDNKWLRVKLDTLTQAGHETSALALARESAAARPELIGHWAQQRFDYYQQNAMWDNALAAIDVALVTALDNATWLRRKLDVLVKLGRENEAQTLARELSSRYTVVVNDWLQDRYRPCLQAEDWQEALAVVDVALNIRGNDPVWMRAKLDTLTLAGREEDARQHAAKFALTHADVAMHWIQQRFDYFQQGGNWPEALAVIVVALEIRGADPVWIRAKLDTLTQAGHEEDARAQARDWAPRYSSVVNGWLQDRYQVYSHDANWPEALKVIEVGLLISTEHQAWAKRQVQVLREANRNREALKHARALAERSDADLEVLRTVVAIAHALNALRIGRQTLYQYADRTRDFDKVQQVSDEYIALERAVWRKWTPAFILASAISLAGFVFGIVSLIRNTRVADTPMTAVATIAWLLAFVAGTCLMCWAIVRAIQFRQPGWVVGLLLLGLLGSWALPFLGPYLYFVPGPGTKSLNKPLPQIQYYPPKPENKPRTQLGSPPRYSREPKPGSKTASRSESVLPPRPTPPPPSPKPEPKPPDQNSLKGWKDDSKRLTFGDELE